MSIRVLIADDHALFREGLAALLGADAGFEVTGLAADGEEALAAARRSPPDVLVLDLAMPRMNGLDAAVELRRRLPGVPVLVLSMHGTLQHAQNAFAAGASGYLLKEATAEEMKAAIRAVYLGRRHLDRRLEEKARGSLNRAAATPLDGLSRRERQVIQGVAEGKTHAEIAEQLHLSTKTVETYRARAMQKLGLDDFASLVKFAVAHGLTPP